MSLKLDKLKNIYEWLYFTLLAIILIVTYSEITMFQGITPLVEFVSVFRLIVIPFAELLLVFNVLLAAFQKKLNITSNDPLCWKPGELITALVTFVILMVPYLILKDDQLFWFAFLIVGAHGIDYKKILKVYFYISLVICVITLICGLTGIIENLVYERADGTKRIAFGFNYPTDFCSHIFFLVISWIWIREEKISIFEIIAIELLGLFTYIACNARTTTITLCVLGIWLFYVKFKNKKNGYKMIKPLQIICIGAATISCIGMTVLSLLYSENSPIMRQLDRFLNTRLSLSHTGFKEYGVTLFGQGVEMIGNGGITNIRENYFFLDCTFINILIRQGLLVLMLVLFIYSVTALSEQKKKRYIHLGLLAFIALQCTIEHHLLEIGHCPLLLAFLSYDMETNTSLIDFSAIKRIFMRKEGETQ